VTTLRPALPGDEDGILALMREFYVHERLVLDETAARRALATLLADPSLGRVWFIEGGGASAGYMVVTLGFSLEFAGSFALLDELYVREGFRRGGAGTRAVEEAAAACAAWGVRALRLEVDWENDAAQRLYRRLGFHAHDRHIMTRWLDRGERGMGNGER
jgi:ribosomal protein S18 acetylase RimI-like enzyme